MATIFDQFEACSVRRDGEAFAELFTDDAVMEFPFAKQRFAGREAIRARAVTAWGASPVIVREFADRIVSAQGDEVCAEYTARVAVEDRPHDVRIVLRLRLRDGRIAHMREYLDPTALAEVRGATTLAVLHRYHDAMRAKSADALADLYAPDAIHEFPFFMANGVHELAGREAIRASYRAGWANHPLDIHAIEDVFVHVGADPEVVTGQFRARATLRATGAPVEITGVLVLRVHAGQIVHTRDFMDALGVAHALGRAPFTTSAPADLQPRGR
ncbi:MAG TPA: nuclear transport factor 2 family protein [Kofleriaceae bacterium]